MALSTTWITDRQVLTKRDQYSDFDPKTQTCSLGFSQGVMVGKKFYVDGGFIRYEFNGSMHEGPNMPLRVIDLSSDPFVTTTPSTVPLTLIDRPFEVPETSGGDLWHYNNYLYLRHGYSENSDHNWPGWNRWANGTLTDFWKYDIKEDSWEMIQHNPVMIKEDGSQEVVPRLRHTASVTVGGDESGDDKKAYVISGEDDKKNVFMQGMLVYDFRTESWSHKSTPWGNWAGGNVVHIPLGKGYLIAFSGRSRADNTLSTIFIYDLGAEQWIFSQPATAAESRLGIPSPRQKSCVVVADAKDGSSWNIYLYGGRNTDGDLDTFNDVWVLSIPSFTWHLVDVDAAADELGPQGAEAAVCAIIRETDEEGVERTGRKMVLYGGRPNYDVCDRSLTRIFDMTTLKWDKDYDPDPTTNTTYEVPSEIHSIIGGSYNGGATLLPLNGFTNRGMERDVQNLYSKLGLDPTSNSTTTTTSSTTTTPVETEPSEDSAQGKNKVTPIVVGVIIGVVVILAIIIGWVWYIKRQKRKRTEAGGFAAKSELESHTGAGFWRRWQRGGESELDGKRAQQEPQELHGYMPPEMPAKENHHEYYGSTTAMTAGAVEEANQTYQSQEIYPLNDRGMHQEQQYQSQEIYQPQTQPPYQSQEIYQNQYYSPPPQTQEVYQQQYLYDTSQTQRY